MEVIIKMEDSAIVIPISVRIEKPILDRLDVISEKEKRSRNNMINILIDRVMDAYDDLGERE